MNADDVYKRLFTDSSVKVAVDPAGYHALRVALLRRHRDTLLLELSDEILASSYDKAAGIATFRLQQPRPPLEFTIL